MLDIPLKVPTEYGNNALWLDGDDFDTFSLTGVSGNQLSQWRDKSGRGYHATPNGILIPTSAAQRINGRSAPLFDGVGFIPLSSGLYNFNTSGTGTIIVVAKSSGPNAVDRPLIAAQSNASTVCLAMQQRNVGPGVRFRAGTSSADSTFAVGTNTRVWVMRKDAGTVRPYIDNNILSTNSAANTVITQSFNIGKFDAFPTQIWIGSVCEVIMFYDTKSLAVINEIRANYLAPKWGTVSTVI